MNRAELSKRTETLLTSYALLCMMKVSLTTRWHAHRLGIERRTPEGRVVGFAVFNVSKHDRDTLALPLEVRAA